MLWIVSEILPPVTMVAYFATSIRMVMFRRTGLSHHRKYAALASVLIGVTLCAGLEILIFNPLVSPGQCAISLMFFFATLRAKGNVASILRAG